MISDISQLWLEIEPCLSVDRVTPYRHATDRDELDALARYLWNTALCEALYPCMHGVEIMLRNAIYSGMHRSTRNPTWYDDPRLGFGTYQTREIAKAKSELARHAKPPDPGRVVAELHFGFWTSLFSRQFDRTIVIPIFPIAFAGMPRPLRVRHTLSRRFDDVRNLRNRVFHHEPIWHWADLPQRHQEVLEAIAWMSDTKRRYVEAIDRFDTIHSRGWQHYRTILSRKLLSGRSTGTP